MYYVGVDIGGTNIATGIMNEDGKLLRKVSVKTLGDRAPEEITKDIAKTVSMVIKEEGVSEKDIKCIGAGVPGCVDNKTGRIIVTHNMNLSDFNFVAEMKKYTDIPVFMGNDANCAALGEVIGGSASGCESAVMITLGTGIGGGFITNKKVYEGFNGAAMEVGHMVIYADGKPCNCGRHGCFERYASATALCELTEEYIEKYPNSYMAKLKKENGKVSGRTAFDAARAGDEAGEKVVELFSKYLASGIISIINLLQPEYIIVGGGVANEGEYLLKRVRNYMEKEVYAYGKIPSTKIIKAELGNDAGIIGAGFLGL